MTQLKDEYTIKVTQEHFHIADSCLADSDVHNYICNTCPLAIALAEQVDDPTIAWWVEDGGLVYAKLRAAGVDLMDCVEIAKYEYGPSGIFVINSYDIIENNDSFREALVVLTRIR